MKPRPLAKPSKPARRSPVIRRLRAGDIDATVGLLMAQLDEHKLRADAQVIRRILAQFRRDSRLGFVLVAVGRKRQIVGVALGPAFLGLEYAGLSGWLEELFVAPEYRNQGVGSALVREFIRTATRLGWRAIDIEVDASHRRAAALYRRLGFESLSRRRFAINLF